MPKNNRKLRVRIVAKKATNKKNEVTRLGAALRTLGGLGGGAVGSLFGAPTTGTSFGTGLGAALSRWLGSGDYKVASNSVVSQSLKGNASIPSMHAEGQSVIVRHKEFVTEVRGYNTFTVRGSYDINPGRAETFPWLAGVAARFQEYKTPRVQDPGSCVALRSDQWHSGVRYQPCVRYCDVANVISVKRCSTSQ